MLEDRRQRPRHRRADELEVARRNLEPGTSPRGARRAPGRSSAPSEQAIAPDRRRRPRTGAPDGARRGAAAAADPLQPVKQVPRLEQRRVERLAVEADERARARQLGGDALEQRPLVGVARQQELPRDEPAVRRRTSRSRRGTRSVPAPPLSRSSRDRRRRTAAAPARRSRRAPRRPTPASQSRRNVADRLACRGAPTARRGARRRSTTAVAPPFPAEDVLRRSGPRIGRADRQVAVRRSAGTSGGRLCRPQPAALTIAADAIGERAQDGCILRASSSRR